MSSPLSSACGVVIGLDLDFMLENPIAVIPTCYKHVFGTLSHLVCLPYVEGTVFWGTKIKSVVEFEMENSGFRVEEPHWMTSASCCVHEEFMVKVMCSFKVPTLHYLVFCND